MSRLKNILRNPSVRTLCWVVIWLLLMDAVVSVALGTKAGSATSLGRYFEYGRSVEGKLMRAMAADPLKEGQILSAGWIEPDLLKKLPDRPQEGADLLVAVYGQSFAMQAAKEAAALDGRLTIRAVGGPAAPPNHSYAAYKADAGLRKADVVVLGVLSASVGDMGSYSGLIWHFENPAPFTFPRYHLKGTELVEEQPLIRSEAAFKQAFSEQSQQWKDFRTQLRSGDRGYDRFVFDASPADASSIVRLVRRGWVAHDQGYEDGVYDPEHGFNPRSEDVQALKAMIKDMARRCKERSERFVVLLLHTQGQSDHLHTALAGMLAESQIDYVSTRDLFAANDPTNFLPDSHYVPAANRKLAAALLQRIRATPSTAGQR